MGAIVGVRRIIAVAAVAMAGAALPAVAQAQVFGSLAQLQSPNNCIVTGTSSSECSKTAPGLNGSEDIVVSPDGANVYVLSSSDDAITEFARNADGSLTQIGCIADITATDSTCSNQSAHPLFNPQAIAISPGGQDVYVAAEFDEDIGDVAELPATQTGR